MPILHAVAARCRPSPRIAGQSAYPGLRVSHDRFGIIAPDEAASRHLFRGGHGPWGMYERIAHSRQFGNMRAYIPAAAIKSLRLSHRVQYPEPWLGVAAG